MLVFCSLLFLIGIVDSVPSIGSHWSVQHNTTINCPDCHGNGICIIINTTSKTECQCHTGYVGPFCNITCGSVNGCGCHGNK